MDDVGVILFNMGGPSTADEVPTYLKEIFRDPLFIRMPLKSLLSPLIIALRTPQVRLRYQQIGGGSPLLGITVAQGAALAQALACEGIAARVVVGMRYTQPRMAEAIRTLLDSGARTLVAVSMYPHFCGATTGSSLAEFHSEIARLEMAPRLAIIDRYGTEPGYVAAMAQTVRPLLAQRAEKSMVLFSAHGIPKSLVRGGDPYVDEIYASAAAIADRLGLSTAQYAVSFQSRMGPVKWVGPSTDETIDRLAREGQSELIIVPISFVAENLETLYDIEIVLRQRAAQCGIASFRRAPALNESPAFAQFLATRIGQVFQAEDGALENEGVRNAQAT